MLFAVVSAAIVIACAAGPGTPVGPGPSYRVTQSLGGFKVVLHWKEVRKRYPGEGGSSYTLDLLSSGDLRVSGSRVQAAHIPLPAFERGFDVQMVRGPRNVCGVVTPLALLPGDISRLPVLVVFGAEIDKGCRPVTMVFVPMHASENTWRYSLAPRFGIEHPEDQYPSTVPPFFPIDTFRIVHTHLVALPGANRSSLLARGHRRVGPAAIVVAEELRNATEYAREFQPGDQVELGEGQRARLIGRALVRYDSSRPRLSISHERNHYYKGFVLRGEYAARHGDFQLAVNAFDLAGQFADGDAARQSAKLWLNRAERILQRLRAGTITRQQAIADWLKYPN